MTIFQTIRNSLTAMVMLLAIVPLKAQSSSGQAKAPTNATFAYSTDVHVSFDGISDLEGVAQQNQNIFYAELEFLPSKSGMACAAGVKGLCNQISEVQKLNALPSNSWANAYFEQNGVWRILAGAGKSINPPQGVILGGDLTDCGGGNLDSDSCPFYGKENLVALQYPALGIYCSNQGFLGTCSAANTDSSQLEAFVSVYDSYLPQWFDFSQNSYLTGMRSPDARLTYPIYPGLGNHDIDNAGTDNEIKNYIAEWNPSGFGSRKVTNSDPDSTSYSWDWGQLHIVNVGVFPGSDNSVDGENNYQFSQAALNWLAVDLQEFAGDGRPVILAAHFGFDSESLKNLWWGPNSPRSQAIPALWPILKQHNIIGYFHGHNHWPGKWYQFPNASNSTEGGPVVPYDIFNSGPGFEQDFVVSHVTDSYMDVMFTQEGSQANGSSVSFGTSFTKILSMPPVVNTSSAYHFTPLEDVAVSLNVKNSTYLISGFSYLSGTDYEVHAIASSGQPTAVCRGNLSLPSQMQGMISYVASDGSGHVLVNLSNALHDYRLGDNNCLTQDWTTGVDNAQAITVLNISGQNYLLADAYGCFFKLYKLSPSGLQLIAQSNSLPLMEDRQMVQLQRGSAVSADSTAEVIRFDPKSGNASFVLLDLSTLSSGSFQATPGTSEQWAPGSIALVSNPNAAWPATGEHLNEVLNTSASSSAESPLYIRTVVPLNDSLSHLLASKYPITSLEATDVSWRGAVYDYPKSVLAMFPLPSASGPSGFAMEAYSSDTGMLTQLTFPWVQVH